MEAIFVAHLEELAVLKSVDLASVRDSSPPNSAISEVFPAADDPIVDELASNCSSSEVPHFAWLPYLRYARIRSHQQRERFKITNNGRIGVVLGNRLRRNVYSEVWKRINTLTNKPIHLYGPAGLGKSFILFGVACTLLQDHMLAVANNDENKMVHVAYIRDAGLFFTESHFLINFVEALCVAYYDRNDILERLVPFLTPNSFNTNEILRNLEQLLRVLQSINLGNLVVIVDQLNGIPEGIRILWDDLCSFLVDLPHVCFLTSASANNFGSEYAQSSFPIYLRFTENEALALLASYGMELSRQDSEFEAKLSAIKHATGLIPLELRLFAETNIADFWQKIDAFVTQRTKVMTENHKKYARQVDSDDLIDYQNSLLAIAFGTKSPVPVFDRQLIVESDNPDEISQMVPCSGRYLVAISGVARQVLMNRIDFRSNPTSEFLKSLLSNTSNVSLVGQTVELYITQMIAAFSNQNVCFNWPVTQGSNLSKAIETVAMHSYNVHFFYGHGAPAGQIQFDKAKNGLFIPRSSYYPTIDIIFYSPHSTTKLYVFQICVSRDVSNHAHSKPDFESGLLHAWIDYLGLEPKEVTSKRQRLTRSYGSPFDYKTLYKFIWVVGSEAVGLEANSLKCPIEFLAKENGDYLNALLSFKVSQ